MRRAVKKLSTELRYGSKTVEELIEDILIKDLSVLFDDSCIVGKVVDVMNNLPLSVSFTVQNYQQICKNAHTNQVLARKDCLNRQAPTGTKLQIAIGAELKKRSNFATLQCNKRVKTENS